MLTQQDWITSSWQATNSLTTDLDPTARPRVLFKTESPQKETLPESLSTSLVYKNRRPIRFGLAYGLPDDWEMIQPIPMILGTDQKNQNYIVKDELVGEYGIGETIEAAKQDYLDNLVTLYTHLQKRKNKGDPGASQQFAKLETYLRPLKELVDDLETALEESVLGAYAGITAIKRITLEEHLSEYIFNCFMDVLVYNDELMDELLEREYAILQQFSSCAITFHYIPVGELLGDTFKPGNAKVIFGV